MSRFDSFECCTNHAANYLSVLVPAARLAPSSLLTTSLSARSQHRHIMIARIGFPSSRVASRPLVPYGEEASGGLSGAPWKFFEITTSTENYGILRGAISVAAELSDFFPNVRTASKSTPQAATVRRVLFPMN